MPQGSRSSSRSSSRRHTPPASLDHSLLLREPAVPPTPLGPVPQRLWDLAEAAAAPTPLSQSQHSQGLDTPRRSLSVRSGSRSLSHERSESRRRHDQGRLCILVPFGKLKPPESPTQCRSVLRSKLYEGASREKLFSDEVAEGTSCPPEVQEVMWAPRKGDDVEEVVEQEPELLGNTPMRVASPRRRSRRTFTAPGLVARSPSMRRGSTTSFQQAPLSSTGIPYSVPSAGPAEAAASAARRGSPQPAQRWTQPLLSAMPQTLLTAVPQPLLSSVPQPLLSAVSQPLLSAVPQPLLSAVSQPLLSAVPQPLLSATPSVVMRQPMQVASFDDRSPRDPGERRPSIPASQPLLSATPMMTMQPTQFSPRQPAVEWHPVATATVSVSVEVPPGLATADGHAGVRRLNGSMMIPGTSGSLSRAPSAPALLSLPSGRKPAITARAVASLPFMATSPSKASLMGFSGTASTRSLSTACIQGLSTSDTVQASLTVPVHLPDTPLKTHRSTLSTAATAATWSPSPPGSAIVTPSMGARQTLNGNFR